MRSGLGDILGLGFGLRGFSEPDESELKCDMKMDSACFNNIQLYY